MTCLASSRLKEGPDRARVTLDVQLPLPFVITAAGYVEKYGLDERYNYLHFIRHARCPVLITLGSLEIANNMAFRGSPEALAELAQKTPSLCTVTIPDADHFYTNARAALFMQMERWLCGLAK